MDNRKIENSTKLEGVELNNLTKVILEKFFTTKSEKMLFFRYSCPTRFTYHVYSNIFRSDFFCNSGLIYLCFPNSKETLDIYSINASNSVEYLLSPNTYDYETDIYIYTPEWFIRYIDEFIDDDNRMTFLDIDHEINLDSKIIQITDHHL